MSRPEIKRAVSHLDVTAVLARIRERGSFLIESEVAALGQHETSRLWPVLVRCHGGRFTAPMQDAAHFIACAIAGGDSIRDVSLVSSFTGYDSFTGYGAGHRGVAERRS